jgi:hypothetical protein
MSSTEIIEDIQRGHEIVTKITGREPMGFRAPHFGLFQSKEQLALQYDTLRSLDYKYSTSTLPQFAFQHGPIFDVGGLYEIPLSGSYKSFFNILDSWNNIISPQNPVLKENYADLFIQTVDALCKMNLSGLLNYYVDPAHVCHNDYFYRAILHAQDCGVETLHYNDVIALVERSQHKTSLKVLTEA